MLVPLAVTAAATALVAVVLARIFRAMDIHRINKDYRQCAGGWWEAELNRCSDGLLEIPQQPVNTWSNLAYLAGGVFVAALLVTPELMVIALASAYLCIGSSLYHGTSTRWAGSLDVSAIYAVFSGTTVFALFRLLRLEGWLMALLMLAVSGLAAYLLRYKYKGNMQLKIGIFIALTYLQVVATMHFQSLWHFWPWALTSFAFFGLAFLAWNMDKNRTFPLKRWGHGFWHILTAAGVALLSYSIHLLGAA